jgi:hypothetical protein
MGHKLTNDSKKSVRWSSVVNEPPYHCGLEKRSRPLSMGAFNRLREETTQLYPSQTNANDSRKIDQNPDHKLGKTDDAVFIPKPEVRKRPRSMLPFSKQKQTVDLSVAKKEGGILEGLQKTDKKAVIDKLKQWRNEKLKKEGGPEKNGVAKEFHRVVHGYQSDNEGGYRMRNKPTLAPKLNSVNEADVGM